MATIRNLKWKRYFQSISKELKKMRHQELFADSTIVCHEKQFPVHRVILSSSSLYFKEIFERNQHNYPIIIMNGIHPKDLEVLLDFIYEGEANISQERLSGVVKEGQNLKIKGFESSNKSLFSSERIENTCIDDYLSECDSSTNSFTKSPQNKRHSSPISKTTSQRDFKFQKDEGFLSHSEEESHVTNTSCSLSTNPKGCNSSPTPPKKEFPDRASSPAAKRAKTISFSSCNITSRGRGRKLSSINRERETCQTKDVGNRDHKQAIDSPSPIKEEIERLDDMDEHSFIEPWTFLEESSVKIEEGNNFSEISPSTSYNFCSQGFGTPEDNYSFSQGESLLKNESFSFVSMESDVSYLEDETASHSHNQPNGKGIIVRQSHNIAGKISWDKLNYCQFCSSPYTNLTKHLIRSHEKENEVRAIIGLEKGSKERKFLLEKLRNRGNYLHNCEVISSGIGEIIPWRCPPSYVPWQDYVHCPHCLAFFQKREFWRHCKDCSHKKSESET